MRRASETAKCPTSVPHSAQAHEWPTLSVNSEQGPLVQDGAASLDGSAVAPSALTTASLNGGTPEWLHRNGCRALLPPPLGPRRLRR